MRISKDKSLRNNKDDKINDSYPSTAGGTVNPYRLVYFSSGKTVEAAAESSVVCGASGKDGAVNNGSLEVFFGHVNLKAGSAITGGDKLKCCGGGRVSPIIGTQAAIGTGTAGNFANQPAGAKVTAVSDNNVADKIPTLTVYGTITGKTTEVTSEVIQLNGTTEVDTVITTWQNILGLELSAACTGTITVKDATGTIITISAGTLQKGVVSVASGSQNAYGSVVRIVAGAASTKAVGIIGLGVDGVETSAVAALNGATEKDIASTRFASVTKILIGDVATGTVATVNTAAAESGVTCVGRALESGVVTDVIECYINTY